jgi:hypothetical protein
VATAALQQEQHADQLLPMRVPALFSAPRFISADDLRSSNDNDIAALQAGAMFSAAGSRSHHKSA